MKTFKYLVLLATAITCSACDLFDHSSREPERAEITKAEYFLRVDKLPGTDYTSTVSKVTFNEYDLIDGNKNNENSETIFYTGTLELKKAEYEENPRAEEIAALYNNHAMRRSKHMIDEEFIGYTPKFYKFDFGNSQYALELSKNNDKITFEYDWNGYITKYEGKKEVENNNYKVLSFNVERIN